LNPLDWILIFVVVAYALSGFFQGFITGAFSTLGLLGGGLVGIWLVPKFFGTGQTSLLVSLGAIGVVLLCASIGQAALQFFGTRIRNRIHWKPIRAVDAVGGAALSMAAVLAITWALGVAVSSSGIPWLSANVRSSTVLATVNRVMPSSATQALNGFADVIGSDFFPRYLEPFAPEQIVSVAPPPAKVAKDPDVVAAANSVVKVRGENICNRGVEGSGFVFAFNHVMTNAHVVAGVRKPTVLLNGSEYPATVVYFDPEVDVAVLWVPHLKAPVLRFDTTGASGEGGAILGYPQDGPYTVTAARIRNEQTLRSPDIYGSGTVTRDVFSVRARVIPGNSGGPLLSLAGKVLGVVFAASLTDNETGYALTADQVAKAAEAARSSTTSVSTQGCA